MIGAKKYRIDDETGESIYNGYPRYPQEYVSNHLNRPILWKTNEEGFVTLEFPFVNNVKEKYLPEQLPNLLSFYGAIYTFYNQDFTEDIFRQFNLPERGENLKKYRDWIYHGVFRELTLNPLTNVYRISIMPI